MKVAIFSDVHGNLTALKAVLESISQEPDIDRIIFAGDIGAFGPRPDACIDLIQEGQVEAITGNADEWILKPPQLHDGLSEQERERRLHLQAILFWTREQLSGESLRWLENLQESFSISVYPSSEPVDELLIVHANPIDLTTIIFPSEERQIELYGRVRQPDAELKPLFGQVRAATIAYGHLHIPNIRKWQDKLLVNISSVSIPGDGDPRAKYTTLDWDKSVGWTANIRFVSYDVEDEIAAYSVTKLPGWHEFVSQLESSGYFPQNV